MPTHAIPHHLDLTGVHAGPDLEADGRHGPTDRDGAAYGACRPVEGGEEPIAGGIDLAAPETSQLFANDGVMPLKQLLPGSIANGARVLGGPDDVGEQDGGEHPLAFGWRPDPGQELLHLVENRVGVAEVRQVIRALELHELCTGNAFREIARVARVAVDVTASLQDERRHLDGSQDRPHIDLGVHAEIGKRVAGPMGQPLVLAPPPPERLVGYSGRRHLGQEDAGAPGLVDLSAKVLHPCRASAPRIPIPQARRCVRPVQDDRPGSLRIGGGEQDRHRGLPARGRGSPPTRTRRRRARR
jgi:hypothetical protein